LGTCFARSSTSEHEGIYVTGREASDPLGTMRPMAAVQVSAVGYTPSSNGTPIFRFGDYFGVDVDPSDGQTFWCAGEYATATNTSQAWNPSFTVAPGCTSPTTNPPANTASVCSVPFTSSAPSLATGTNPITWSLVGPTPAGLTIDPGTGVVSWPN